jgi:hypothetical protein
LDGEFTVTSAAELKRLLMEWQESGTDLQLDLERAEGIDITAMQFLWVAGSEAARVGVGVESRVSEAAARAACDAGFEPFPGCPGRD